MAEYVECKDCKFWRCEPDLNILGVGEDDKQCRRHAPVSGANTIFTSPKYGCGDGEPKKLAAPPEPAP